MHAWASRRACASRSTHSASLGHMPLAVVIPAAVVLALILAVTLTYALGYAPGERLRPLRASAAEASERNASVLRVQNAGLLFTDNQAGVSGTDAGYSIPLERLWIAP